MIAHISHVLIGHIFIVDAEDDVSLLQSHFGSRHILVWFADADTLQLEVVAHHGTHTGIFTGEHILQFVDFLLWIVSGIRVQTTQHSLDTIAHHLFGIERIHVHEVQILVDGVEYIHILRRLEIMISIYLCKSRCCEQHHEQRNQYFFHAYLYHH